MRSRRLAGLFALALLAGCARTHVKGPADPSKLHITMNVQPTSLGVEAVSAGVMSERPWTLLRWTSMPGDSAAVRLPGALLAMRFDVPEVRGPAAREVFSTFLARADEWDTLKTTPAAANVAELSRVSRWVALFRPVPANPYAPGSPDAQQWDAFRITPEQARTCVQLVAPKPPPGSWDKDTLDITVGDSSADSASPSR